MSLIADTAAIERLTAEVDPDQFRPYAARTRTVGLLAIAVIVAAAVTLPLFFIRAKERQFAADLQQRLEILAQGRAAVIATWAEGLQRVVDPVVQADVFRLFATEMDLAQGDIARPGAPLGQPAPQPSPQLGDSLVAQLPYMTQVLTEFVQNTSFAGAFMVARNGQAYVATAGAPPLLPGQREAALAAIAARAPAFGAVRDGGQGLVLDMALPLFPPQVSPDAGPAVAALVFAAPMQKQLAEFMAPRALAPAGEALHILQRAGGRAERLAPGEAPALQPVAFDAGSGVARRNSLAGGTEAFALAAAVPGLRWWVVQEVDAAQAQAGLRTFTTVALGISGLVVVLVVTAFGAFWWRVMGEHNRALAWQFKRLAGRIEAQRRLLDSINNAIADWIGLKTPQGHYTYVNPAFAAAVQRPVEQAIGLDDAALFGHGTAARLKLSDQQALAGGKPVSTHEEIYLAARLRHVHLAKMPLRGDDGALAGIVSVGRDVTDLVEQQQRRERAVKQTVVALVRAIELRDPYLGGHSRRVAGFAQAVAQRLAATPEQMATLEIAANLSQIGKLAVPRTLLTKPGRLTPEEVLEMQRHVDYARTILRDIDFDLPVFETIHQMNERLDGTGYPRGLKEGEIGLTGRILGACDVFCARVAPRSYRPPIAAEEALDILSRLPRRYDEAVIAAIREVARTPQGEKLLGQVD